MKMNGSPDQTDKYIVTTLGPVSINDPALKKVILPHEHVFVDLRTWDSPGYAQAQADDVVALMAPELIKARDSGIGMIVESTPVGVGRRVDILKVVSQATGYPLVVPTGVYREPWIPPWVHDQEENVLCEWMQSELEEGIERTGVKAGWIKLSAGDDGLTTTETKVLRAAARTALRCGAVIGSHTIRGRIVDEQLSILENCGYSADRFIWIHAQIDPDFDQNQEIAWQGAWIEYDAIGDPAYDEVIVNRVLRMLDAGLGDQVLLSHDRGWYDPAQPGGGIPRSYTYLLESFLPRLRQEGVDEATLEALTCGNPIRAFSRYM